MFHEPISRNSPGHPILPSPPKTCCPTLFIGNWLLFHIFIALFLAQQTTSFSFPDCLCIIVVRHQLDCHFLIACYTWTSFGNHVHPFGFFAFDFFAGVCACLSLIHWILNCCLILKFVKNFLFFVCFVKSGLILLRNFFLQEICLVQFFI